MTVNIRKPSLDMPQGPLLPLLVRHDECPDGYRNRK